MSAARVRILCLGDSLTEGYTFIPNAARGGYRYPLMQYLAPIAASKKMAIQFVGPTCENATLPMFSPPYPYMSFNQTYHGGYPGYRIDQIQGMFALPCMAADTINDNGYMQLGCWAARASVNIVLLQLGTNDILQGADATTAATKLRSLVDGMLFLMPNTIIIVAKIPPLLLANVGKNPTVVAFNAMIDLGLGGGRVPRVLVVDNYTPFILNPSLMNIDGIHPSGAPGYIKTAGQWLVVLGPLLQSLGRRRRTPRVLGAAGHGADETDEDEEYEDEMGEVSASVPEPGKR